MRIQVLTKKNTENTKNYPHVKEISSDKILCVKDMELVITLCDVPSGRPCFGLSKGGGSL